MWPEMLHALRDAGWRNYSLFLDDDGTLTIPADLVDRWKRQAVTPYLQLTSLEQDSDRAEADRILAIVAGKNSEGEES